MKIEIHADDYAMFPGSSRMIIDCINNGCVNGTSIMPNSSHFEECMRIFKDECKKDAYLSIHLDLITGKAMSGPGILTDSEGFFNISYFRYILISLIPFYRTKYLRAIKKELSMQIDAALPFLDRNHIRIDSHRHIHMVPAIFFLVMSLIREKGLKLEYIRITKDAPFVFKGLMEYEYFRPVNIIKSLLMMVFGTVNEIRFSKALKGKTAYFASILFSGSITKKNLLKILENYRGSRIFGRNLEIMVHPYQVTDRKDIDNIHDSEDRSYVADPLRMKENEAVNSAEVIGLLQSIVKVLI